jgi:hypothetical protein
MHEDAENPDAQTPDTGITIQEADNVLTSLVHSAFFHKQGQYYSLAPRALMELRAYLKEMYNDDDAVRIRDCEGCREIVTHGVRCNNRECGVRWHDGCANSYYRGRKSGGRACPKCREQLKGVVFVGERADRVGGRRSAVQREEEEEEEGEEEEEEDE